MRINKYIASCNVCSRRKAETYITAGKVKLNGKIVLELATDVDEAKDVVEVDGKIIHLEQKKVYIMLNKPKGYVTTSKEQFSRPSVLDLIHENIRVFPIGRLDMYTEGLLLLTNDGEFANKLMHPKNEIKKIYIAKVKGVLTEQKLNALRSGVDIGGYITRPAEVVQKNTDLIQITISEGKNRQIRKMCLSQNLEVVDLKRVKIGNISLENLAVGKYIFLTKKQIENI